MRNLLPIIFFLTLSSLTFSRTIVTATILNSNSKFVYLTYMGSSDMSSPNYFGDKRICEQISNNEFKFIFNTDPRYSLYLLEFYQDHRNIKILIRDGDSIHISYDFKNMIKTCIASGKGSSLTNYLFADEIILPKSVPKMASEEIIPFGKNLQIKELSLIACFKTKRLKDINDISIDEKTCLERLIMSSKLTLEEFKLLENRTYYYIATAISRTPFDYLIKNLDKYLKLYSNIDLSKDFILNDYVTDDLTDCFVYLNCFKECIEKKGSYDQDTLKQYNSKNFNNTAKKMLRGKTLEKLICDQVYNSMLEGKYDIYDKLYIANMAIITDKHYVKRIKDFHSNYLTALNNPNFKLDMIEKVLNDSTVFTLLNSSRGHKLYLIIWKVGSGSSYPLSPLYELQTIKKLYSIYEPMGIKFIDICIDDGTLKQHWASSIVNHDWHGDHYYYPSADSSKFRIRFAPVRQLYGCDSELYYILDENGNIIKYNKSMPIMDRESILKDNLNKNNSNK